MKKIFFIIVFAGLIVGALIFINNQVNSVSANVPSSTDATCPKTGDWTKIDGTSPGYQAPSGKIIIEVCIKGGQEGQSANGYEAYLSSDGWFQQPAGTNCVGASGIGTNSASTYRSGSANGNECANISHSSFRTADAPPPLPENATASATPQGCVQGVTNTTPVYLSVTGATMHVHKPGGEIFDHTGTDTYYDWPEGSYGLTYTPSSGYVIPQGLTTGFTIDECKYDDPEDATASAVPQACVKGISINTPVKLSVTGATMHVNPPVGSTWDHTGTNTYNNLEVGNYGLSYTALPGFQIPAGLPTNFDVDECKFEDNENAYASIILEECGVNDQTRPVTIAFRGFNWVKLTPPSLQILSSVIEQTDGAAKTYNGLEVGFHALSVELADGFEDPGDIPSGIEVFACSTKEENGEKDEPKVDPQPDIPAGGQGPSLIGTIAPVGAGISGLAVAWYFLKDKFLNK